MLGKMKKRTNNNRFKCMMSVFGIVEVSIFSFLVKLIISLFFNNH